MTDARDRYDGWRLNVPMDLPHPDPSSSPIQLFQPGQQTVPLVFASPHSGRDYPAHFVADARLDPLSLRRSEDGFVDELFLQAPNFGAPLLCATFPRAFCDPNREPWELDPTMFDDTLPAWVNTSSARVGAGLGTIARVVASGESIYRRKLRFAEAQMRVNLCWQPYHDQLLELISATKAKFGVCLLIDCHSMPDCGVVRGRSCDFVLGDAHATTCAAPPMRMIERVLTELGYRVRRNDPYAGGYVTRHYGRPREGVHALQIEIARPLYMDESRMVKLPQFDTVQRNMTRLISALASAGPGLFG